MSLLGGTPVLAPFPSFVVALKKKLLNKRRTRSAKQVVRLRLFFPLWSVSLGSEMPFQAVVLSSDRKLRTASRRQHCAAQEAREQEKRGGNFLFPFPLWFVYLFDLSTSPSRLSSRQLLGQRWVTHVASPRLLKGCGHGGGHSTEIAINLRQRVNTPASWWHTSCCMWAVSHRGCS